METTILLLVFNRPNTTRQVFEAIQQARPSRLYIAADGPRPGRLGEKELCEEVRLIATAVDWPCKVTTLFREENLGCKLAVYQGITWFFDQEEEGIILEDDIIPTQGFFHYCEELLDRYRHQPEVAMISGCNLVSNIHRCENSYFFSCYNHVWGWASWRRAWEHYDPTMSHWPDMRQGGKLEGLSCGDKMFIKYWNNIFDRVYRCEIDTWDYQWLYSMWDMGAMAILPAYNMTQNIGFGPDGTHFSGNIPEYVKDSVMRETVFPLRHPPEICRDVEMDRLITSRLYKINRLDSIKDRVKKMLGTSVLEFVHRISCRRKRHVVRHSSENKSFTS